MLGTLVKAVVSAAVTIVLLVAVARSFQVIRVAGTSMSPTLNSGDFIVVLRWTRLARLHRYDIVLARLAEDSNLIVKRIIGLPGERVHWPHRARYHTRLLDTQPTVDGNLDAAGNSHDCLVPSSQYFLMGDNAGSAADSRHFGPITRNRISGKAVLKVWPSLELLR